MKFVATVKKFFKAGKDVRATDAEGNTCLLRAAYCGHTDTVRYLLSLPEVDLNHQDSNNYSALHFAVKEKHADVVQVLIDAGAHIETRNAFGHSPLHMASISGELRTVKMLVEAGADVRATDVEGNRCLITVRYLVNLTEVDLDQQGRRNRTALHFDHLGFHQIHVFELYYTKQW